MNIFIHVWFGLALGLGLWAMVLALMWWCSQEGFRPKAPRPSSAWLILAGGLAGGVGELLFELLRSAKFGSVEFDRMTSWVALSVCLVVALAAIRPPYLKPLRAFVLGPCGAIAASILFSSILPTAEPVARLVGIGAATLISLPWAFVLPVKCPCLENIVSVGKLLVPGRVPVPGRVSTGRLLLDIRGEFSRLEESQAPSLGTRIRSKLGV